MRRIRFRPELIMKLRKGKKTMSFRKSVKPNGFYIVEEGGHPIFEHIDTGIRIKIVRNYNVPDIELYAHQFYDQEGFKSPQEFLEYIKKLYRGHLPKHGWGHRFEVLGVQK